MNFPAIREDVEKSAAVIKAASERKAAREEVCPLFKTFAGQGRQDDHVPGNQPEDSAACRPRSSRRSRRNHAKTIRIRNNVCSAGPCRPAAGPTLSDALGGPIIADDTSAKQPGRGTFDTLTGNALQR